MKNFYRLSLSLSQEFFIDYRYRLSHERLLEPTMGVDNRVLGLYEKGLRSLAEQNRTERQRAKTPERQVTADPKCAAGRKRNV